MLHTESRSLGGFGDMPTRKFIFRCSEVTSDGSGARKGLKLLRGGGEPRPLSQYETVTCDIMSHWPPKRKDSG